MIVDSTRIHWLESGSPLDSLGRVTAAPVLQGEPLDASGIYIWRESTIGEFVKKSIELASSTIGFVLEPNAVTGFATVVSVLSLIPLHVKILQDDALANKFLRLVHQAPSGEQYFLNWEIGNDRNLSELVAFYVDKGILRRDGTKLFVCGQVLNRVSVVS